MIVIIRFMIDNLGLMTIYNNFLRSYKVLFKNSKPINDDL
jgi:uncharacterized membrane protein YobD (UPF0266 family)